MYIQVFYQIQNILAITFSNILSLSRKIIRCFLACFPNYKIRIIMAALKVIWWRGGGGCRVCETVSYSEFINTFFLYKKLCEFKPLFYLELIKSVTISRVRFRFFTWR